jgi:hypothetical protein
MGILAWNGFQNARKQLSLEFHNPELEFENYLVYNVRMMMEDGRLKFPLLHNSLDFVLSAAEYAGENSQRSWKYAILHLIAGIELLLKSRLELEHWSLVFQDVDRANESSYTSGDFQSADFQSVCTRLEKISRVGFAQKEREHLNYLRKLRNKIEHFGIDIGLEQVKPLVAHGINFVLCFCEEHLKPQIGEAEQQKLDEIVLHLREFQEFVSERLTVVAPMIPKGALLRECPRCFQDTLALFDEDTFKCYFCGYQMEITILAQERSEMDVENCPECGKDALAFIVYNNESAGWECFACGAEFEKLERCTECGQLHTGEGPMCHECFAHIVNKDNS